MNPFEYPGEFVSTEATGVDVRDSSEISRPRIPLFIVLTCVVISLFLPWIQVRIPSVKPKALSLFEFRGGSGFVIAFMFVCVSGLLMWFAKLRIGSAITAVAVAFVGWFGALVNISVSAIRGMIPQLGVGNLDLGRGLIGVGAGAIIVIAGLILVAMELLPRQQSIGSRPRSLDGFGVAGFLLGVTLAMTHTAVWISGSSEKFDSDLRLSGDSLFGTFVLSSIVWLTAILGVLIALQKSNRGRKALAVMLVLSGLAKFFHALVFLVGNGILNFLLPNSVGEIASLRTHWPLWITMILSVICIAVGFGGLVSEQVRDGVARLVSFEYVPSIALAIATCATLIVSLNGTGTAQSDGTSGSVESVPSVPPTGETSIPNQSGTTAASADYIAKSVVLVIVSTATGEVCWSGSGVAVLDGQSILTNDHVVTPEPGDDPACNVISVGITSDSTQEPSEFIDELEVVANDSDLDLALLRLPDVESIRLRPVPILNDRLAIDAKIRVIGYPGVGGNTITLSEGVISGIDRRSGSEFYKVSAQISPGNSGGPVVDADGNLIGIATAYMPADVNCEDRDACYAEGANLGLVRPIALASSVLTAG